MSCGGCPMSISFCQLNSSAFGLRVARSFALLLLLLLAEGFSQAQAAGIALVQHVGKDAGTTTTSTLAFASSNTAGNFIGVAVRGGLSSAQVFTITDSNGNTYKQAAQVGYTGSAVTSAIYYAENIKGGANTVTVSMTVSGPLRFAILEYSGVAASGSLDATAVNTATSSAPNSGNLTTTVSGDLLLATVGTTNPAMFTAGTGYTIRDFVPAEPNTKLISEDQIQTTAGVASASASLGASDTWGAVLAAFKAAGGGAGSPSTMTANAGTTPQSATINTAFANPLAVTVQDAGNNPVSGVNVTFTAPGSGASGVFSNSTGTIVVATNASGVASAPFTANATAGGPYTVTAGATGLTTVNFSLTNTASAPASIALVQHTSKDAGTTTTSPLAFVSPNTAGNWIAVTIRGGLSSSQVFTVVDSNGNTYRQAAQIGFTSSQVTLAIYYAENIKGGANTITVSQTVSGPLRFAILEYSGVATSNSLDVFVTATGTSSSPNSGNLTTTASGDLLLGAIASTNAGAFTAGSGYTIRDFVPAEPNTKLITEDQIQTTAGVASASASLGAAGTWGAGRAG